ncbi:FadR/GntR family transcriptional regulator [Microbacterium sp. NPDC089695]|uniref:FadR/GntR family transcriptional regulator n=1 Tax=Microbacterium sp. NPDC089695 TaxID=3364198 RepID=UPI0038089FAF
MPAFPGEPVDEIAAALTTIPSGSPVSEVARRLLDLFTGGSIPPGTRLPPERQLSATLGVGRSAVREALAALEILGIVDVRPGSGTYLRGAASELLPQTLRWGLLIGERNTAQLLELREGLEIFVARLAASRADGATIARLERCAERMRDSIGDLPAFAKADLEFHQVLAEAAGNETLTDHVHVVRSLLQVYADRAVHDRGHAEHAVAEHEAVLEAVRRGDQDAAASAMAVHMSTATARLLDA